LCVGGCQSAKLTLAPTEAITRETIKGYLMALDVQSMRREEKRRSGSGLRRIFYAQLRVKQVQGKESELQPHFIKAVVVTTRVQAFKYTSHVDRLLYKGGLAPRSTVPCRSCVDRNAPAATTLQGQYKHNELRPRIGKVSVKIVLSRSWRSKPKRS
jgi:hypothetical protein